MTRPKALGYLRRDVSGATQRWHEAQIRILARQLGYELTKTLVFSARTQTPVTGLIAAVHRTGVTAVITPTVWHFGSRVPDELAQVADVITVTPKRTYPRTRP
ncbi:hypothetical protein [Nocardia sp. CNY236]|uniref:hypothetical protein n=1 Tax=Nocardia sp. CNY236 TaxID=1169152 RepID=UPI0003F8D44C|nr:hypothetical protein [Nocardia sp. CNY236]